MPRSQVVGGCATWAHSFGAGLSPELPLQPAADHVTLLCDFSQSTPGSQGWEPPPLQPCIHACSPQDLPLCPGGQGSLALGWLPGGPVLGSGKEMSAQVCLSYVAQFFLTPAPSGPRAEKSSQPRLPISSTLGPRVLSGTAHQGTMLWRHTF